MFEALTTGIIYGLGITIGGVIGAFFRKFFKSKKDYHWLFATVSGATLALIIMQLFLLLRSWYNSHQLITSIPLSIVENHDFETDRDITNTKPWVSYPENESNSLMLSQKYARSDDSSLRLMVNFQKQNYKDEFEYGGIGLTTNTTPKLEKNEIVAVSAWVFIPVNEAIQDNNFFVHMIGYSYDNEGKYMGVYSEDTRLTPGVWTPIFWGMSYSTEYEEMTVSIYSKVHEIYISVWDSEKTYQGSIFFDDIIFYTINNNSEN